MIPFSANSLEHVTGRIRAAIFHLEKTGNEGTGQCVCVCVCVCVCASDCMGSNMRMGFPAWCVMFVACIFLAGLLHRFFVVDVGQ